MGDNNTAEQIICIIKNKTEHCILKLFSHIVKAKDDSGLRFNLRHSRQDLTNKKQCTRSRSKVLGLAYPVPTCGYDVKNAGTGGALLPHHIVRPAEYCPELHVGAGCVGQPAASRRTRAVGLPGQQGGGEGVVEGPGEGVGRRVGVHPALHYTHVERERLQIG